MRLPDDYEENSGMNASVLTAIISVTLFIALIFVIVLFSNVETSDKKKDSQAGTSPQISASEENENSEEVIIGGSLSPDDLDFWDQYPESTQQEEEIPESESEESADEPDLEDGLSDGYHTLVTYRDGSEEWVAINDSIPKNTYEPTDLIRHGNIMQYFVNDKNVSYVGVRISEDLDEVDFHKLKSAGVDYCMIKVGARGYSSGKIVLDDNFKDNIKRADEAGLDVGVYFLSQAINSSEAQEEANTVLTNIAGLDVDFPIAFDMSYIVNDTSRTDELTRNDRTKIAQAFLEVIKNAGYHPILYGNKEWLIQEVNLVKLSGYDTWYGEPGDMPDYPYKYTMWEYSDSVKIDGISGYAQMSISFIDYSRK